MITCQHPVVFLFASNYLEFLEIVQMEVSVSVTLMCIFTFLNGMRENRRTP